MAKSMKLIHRLYLERGGSCEICRCQLSFGERKVAGYPQVEVGKMPSGGLGLLCPACGPEIPRLLRAAKRSTCKGYAALPSKMTVLFESAQGKCVYCRAQTHRGRPTSPRRATIEHLIPTSRGGTDDPGNLALACNTCNGLKGDRTPAEFLEALVATCLVFPIEMLRRAKL